MSKELDLSLAVIERDVAQFRKERLDKLILEIQSKNHSLITKPTETNEAKAVHELTFTTLTFEPQKGIKLGDFEIAYKKNNLPDKWQHAYQILRTNNAKINNRYHGTNYLFSYWLYGEDKIYRKKLKAPP